MDDLYSVLIKILVNAVPVVLAITLHEAAHGYVARHFGDSTAYIQGRVTLNPVKHRRHRYPPGTARAGMGNAGQVPLRMGEARPVNFNNLRNPKRDMLWVAAAGPLSNVAQMLAWAVIAKILDLFVSPTGLIASFWLPLALAGIYVNILIAILNLFPILPLDGGRMLASILPGNLSYHYQGTERYGMIILLVLIFTGILGAFLGPLVDNSEAAVHALFGFE